MQYVDLVALSKAKNGKLDINDRDVFLDPYSRVRLEEAKMIDSKGVLTPTGLKTFDQLKARVAALMGGIHFEDRVVREGDPVIHTTSPWLIGQACKQSVVSNGELLVMGKPFKWMGATQAVAEKKQVFQRVVDSGATKVSMKLFPHTYQMLDLGGMEIIWFANKEQDTFVAAQAGYYDVVMARYGSASCYLSKDHAMIQARVRNRGLKNNVVALLAILDTNDLVEPKKRKDWPSASVEE